MKGDRRKREDGEEGRGEKSEENLETTVFCESVFTDDGRTG